MEHAIQNCMLSGACGHTYGANGIWQVNRSDERTVRRLIREPDGQH